MTGWLVRRGFFFAYNIFHMVTLSCQSPQPDALVTSGHRKATLVCEENTAPVSQSPVLIFQGSSSLHGHSVLYRQTRARCRLPGPQVTFMKSILDCLSWQSSLAGRLSKSLLAVLCRRVLSSFRLYQFSQSRYSVVTLPWSSRLRTGSWNHRQNQFCVHAKTLYILRMIPRDTPNFSGAVFWVMQSSNYSTARPTSGTNQNSPGSYRMILGNLNL